MSTELKIERILTEDEIKDIFTSYNTDVKNAASYINEADAFVLNTSASLVTDIDKWTLMMIFQASIHMTEILRVKGCNEDNLINYMFENQAYKLIKEQFIAINTNSKNRKNFTSVDGSKLYYREIDMLRVVRDSSINIDMIGDDLLKKIIACAKAIIDKYGNDDELHIFIEGCYNILNLRMYEELSQVKMPYSTIEMVVDRIILYTGAFTLGWCIGSLIGHVLLALTTNTGGAALYATPGLTVVPA